MQLRGVPIDSVSEADVEALLENEVPESAFVDYKRELIDLTPDESKLEFLKDVSSFANTRGGVLVFGLECKTASDRSVPSNVHGISPTANLDAFRQKCESVLRDGLDPRIPHIEIRGIDMAKRGTRVVLLGISQSVQKPHVVWFQRNGQVWRRSQAGKYQANVEEIRIMVRESDGRAAEIATFREARYERLRRLPVHQAGATFLHILPVGRLDAVIDLVPFATDFMQLSNVFGSSWDPQYNFDGYYVPARRADDPAVRSFTQWLRCGGYELFTERFHQFGEEKDKGYRAYALTEFVHRHIPKVTRFIVNRLGVDPPLALVLTIRQVLGLRINDAPLPWSYVGTPTPIDREVLPVPAVVMDDPAKDVQEAIERVLKVVWQSGGYAGGPPAPAVV